MKYGFEKIGCQDNIIVCKYDLVPFVEEIGSNEFVVGETNVAMIEHNCILVNEDNIFKDGLIRIEYKDHVQGIKIGYLKVGVNEYVVLKSWRKLVEWIVWIILFCLMFLDWLIYIRLIVMRT